MHCIAYCFTPTCVFFLLAGDGRWLGCWLMRMYSYFIVDGNIDPSLNSQGWGGDEQRPSFSFLFFFFFAMQWCMDRQAKFQCLNNYLTLLMLAEFFNRMVGRRSEIQPDRAVASKNCSLYNRTGRTLILMEMNKRCRSKGPRTPLEQSQKYGINHGRGARTQPSRCFKLQPPFNHWSSIGRLITAPN